ncbi:MAG: hypothetical protein KatS3mg054_0089 [Chloroflexus sp.]|nr:MAG: hypothetical protein KatS3mg054_0089 [Chloroflexus sp.]
MTYWYEEAKAEESVLWEWRVSGDAAIVQKGATVVVRLLPHPKAPAQIIQALRSGQRLSNDLLQLYDFSVAPFVKYNIHWVVMVDGSRAKGVCPKSLGIGECAACSAGIAPRKQFAFNAIIWDHTKTAPAYVDERGFPVVRLFPMNPKLFDSLIALTCGPFGVGDVTHPISGRFLGFRRPSGMYDPWTVAADQTPTELPHWVDIIERIKSPKDIVVANCSNDVFVRADLQRTRKEDAERVSQFQGRGSRQQSAQAQYHYVERPSQPTSYSTSRGLVEPFSPGDDSPDDSIPF